MYYTELRLLLGNQTPSVDCFHVAIAGFSKDEQERWIRLVYRMAQSEWLEVNGKYRVFIIRFIESDLQCFLDYLRKETFWGQFVIPIEDPELAMRLVYRLLKVQDGKKSARRILACSLLLLFGSKWKISTLFQYLKIRRITPGDILDLMAWVKIRDEG